MAPPGQISMKKTIRLRVATDNYGQAHSLCDPAKKTAMVLQKALPPCYLSAQILNALMAASSSGMTPTSGAGDLGLNP